jgi:flagellar motility protein MotE (MotC chaperone)
MRRLLMLFAVPMALALAGLALAGCGQSKEEKATNAVCDARGEIQSSVNDLASLTAQTGTADQVQTDLTNIRDNLKKIDDNRADLADVRKAQVTTATQEFTAELNRIVDSLSGLTPANAAQLVRNATTSLKNAYASALAPIDCS